jgi:transposase-like protein
VRLWKPPEAKIALEALRKQATIPELAQRYQVHPNHIYPWKRVYPFLLRDDRPAAPGVTFFTKVV